MRQIITGLLLIFSTLANADNHERLKEANFPARSGNAGTPLLLKSQSVFTYLWVDVYAAAFYSAADVAASQAVSEQRDQRLELYYFRDIDRSDVIKAATTTLQRQQSATTLDRLKPQLDALHRSFLNIRRGDRYALDYRRHQGLELERNGQVIFRSRDPELARAYFGIWLAPEGLSAPLRTSLLMPTQAGPL